MQGHPIDIFDKHPICPLLQESIENQGKIMVILDHVVSLLYVNLLCNFYWKKYFLL